MWNVFFNFIGIVFCWCDMIRDLMKGWEGLGKNLEILCRRNWKSGEVGSVLGVDYVSVGVEF